MFFSVHEPESKTNKKLGRISLIVLKFGKPRISARLNSNTAIQITSLKVIKFYQDSVKTDFSLRLKRRVKFN